VAQSRILAAYPLAWPDNWPRHKGPRKAANFSKAEQRQNYVGRGDITMQEAMRRVNYELERLGVNVINDSVISTNCELNMSGFPRTDRGEPRDPGVAVYWQTKGQPMRVMPIDIYDRTRDNIAAIAATLEAMRKIERHGGAQILDRAFSGFIALPKPSGPDWWEVLKLERAKATREIIVARHRELARARHPDAGGSDHQMAELNRARDQALQELA
jgi:hypothetical protein